MSRSSHKFWRLLQLVKLSWTCFRLVATGQKKLLPQTMYASFRELGGVYVKFLQLMVIRSEAFQALREYDVYDVYDHVNAEQLNIGELLSKELGPKAKDIVLEADTPFAAGSFGQVYKAQYKNKTVILKVLRPSVIKELKFDLKVLGFFSTCIDWFSLSSAIRLRQVYKEFARATTLETNYLLEADYASTLYERYRRHPAIVIPYTYREMSTVHIICQDFVDGIAATELMHLAKDMDVENYVHAVLGSDLKQQLVELGSEVLSSVFFHGTAYGDPHPGNIKFLSGNRIGLIDFGLQAPAPQNTGNFHRLIEQYYKIYSGAPDIRAYSQVLLDMYGGDIIRAAYSLDEYYATGSHKLLDSIINSAERILQDQREQADYLLQNNKMMMLFSTVINKNNRFCLNYELDGPEMIRAGILFISLVTGLGVKNDVLRQTYAQVLERTKNVALSGALPALHPETAIEILAGWFDQIAYKNPQLYRQLKLNGVGYA
jgi:serine/threonine protein kinase